MICNANVMIKRRFFHVIMPIMSLSKENRTQSKKNAKKKQPVDIDIELDDIWECLIDEQTMNETLKKSFLKHLEMTFDVSQSLKRSGLSSKKYKLFLENDEEFSESVKDLSNELVDLAQSKLFEFINIEPFYKDNDGKLKKHPACSKILEATMFFLDRFGTAHGWGKRFVDKFEEKQDNTIEIIIVDPHPNKDRTKKPTGY